DQGAASGGRELTIGESYMLNFKVGAPVTGNLIGGPGTAVPAADVPAGGLAVEWPLIGHDAEVAAATPDTTVTEAVVGGVKTWSARFGLLIPQAGDSAVVQLKVKPLKKNPQLDVIITVRRENYRQFKIALAASE